MELSDNSQDSNRVKRQESFNEFIEDDDDEDEDGDESFISCPRGSSFCLETNRCAPDCAGPDIDQLIDDDGDIFELEDEGDDDDDDDDGDYLRCPPRTVFCMSEMRCQPVCGRDEIDGDWDLDEFEEFDDEEEEEELVCPAGQVFCMQVMACVSNCGFFSHQEKEKEKEEGNTVEIEVTCPEGQVSDASLWVQPDVSLSAGVLYELQPVYLQLHVLQGLRGQAGPGRRRGGRRVSSGPGVVRPVLPEVLWRSPVSAC